MAKKTKGNWEGWNEAIKNMKLPKRPPMWNQAIKFLVSECAIEPTCYDTLTSDQIAQICKSDGFSICCTIVDFGIWVKEAQDDYLDQKFNDRVDEIWLAYLMATRYDKEWDGENWVDIHNGSDIDE